MIKKQILLLLAVLLPVMASAYTALIDDIYYNLDESAKTAEVAKGETYYSGDVVIPPSVTFKGVGYSVTSIGERAFGDCSDLTSVKIPDRVTSIGDYAFCDCSSLTSITIPNSVTSLGELAFGFCYNLTSFTIPNSVTSIGGDAFSGCSGLTSITIPNSVETIGHSILAGCSSLASIIVESDNPWYDSRFDCNAIIETSSGQLIAGCKNTDIPSDVTSIGDYAFSCCSGLTSVAIPNSVTGIGAGAFRECSGLTSITIPNSLTSIGNSAFYKCTGLTSVTIPDGVKSIGNYVFYGCSGLTSVTIPNSVAKIGEGAFENCTRLTSVKIGEWVQFINKNAFNGCSRLTSITIPNHVTSIGEYAFADCSWLTSVTIGENVQQIGNNAFNGCSRLSSVTSLIKNPFEIAEDVFYSNGKDFTSADLYVPLGTRMKYLSTTAWNKFQSILEMSGKAEKIGRVYYLLNAQTKEAEVTNQMDGIEEGGDSYSGSINIPATVSCNGVTYDVTRIGDWAFADCSNMDYVTIPNSVTSIGERAFNNCSGLISIKIPDRVTSIEKGAFVLCSGLTVFTIPNGLKSIENFVFYGCTGLASVKIPVSVTSIKKRAFANCSSLTSVTIPASVTSIEDEAFAYCSSLTSVISLIQKPFEIKGNVFYSESDTYKRATLYVPIGKTGKYLSTSAWNRFEKIEEYVMQGDVNRDATVDVADIATIIDVMAGKAPQYKDQADVNKDHTIDVADIATVIDIMAGKEIVPQESYTTCPDSNHPHWIDLGLPSGTKWACCNTGAIAPEGYGSYYTFDEAQAYNPPTLAQASELINKTTYVWTTQNGVNGIKFTGSNGGTVFLPAGGFIMNGKLRFEGTTGSYWTSTPDGDRDGKSFSLDSGSTTTGWAIRDRGFSVRSVR